MSNIGNKQTMSTNLKYYIERSGKDRKELAEIWGFPYSTVTEWINGRKYPRIDRIEIMADYFGILKSDLIEEKTNKPEPNTMTIGNFFEYLRKQRKLSISEFSEEIGLTEEEIRTYESSKKGIPVDVVKMLADYFDISSEKLTTKQVKMKDIVAAFASTNEAYVQQMSKWVEIFGNERFSDKEFEKLIEYGKFLIYQRGTNERT